MYIDFLGMRCGLSLSDMSILILYSYVPALVLAVFFWWMDRFSREPWWLVSTAFLWGSVGALGLSFFWNTHFDVMLLNLEGGESYHDVFTSVLTAPFVEEINKGIFLLLLLATRRIGSITDGLLMGIIVGLGFAASENVLYALEIRASSGDLAMWYNLWFRELHTTLLHASASAVWGGMIGYGLSFKGFERGFIISIGFVLSVVSHGFWNLLATLISDYNTSPALIETLMRLELAGIFGFLLALFFTLLFHQSRVICRELVEEASEGILPAEHIGYFASLIRWPSLYNLPAGIKPADYVGLAVQLAFSKHAASQCRSPELLAEVRELRSRLKSLTEKS